MSETEIQDMEVLLTSDPRSGDIQKKTGGFRKVRFGVGGRGKSSGVRIIYYYVTKREQIILWDVFKKNERDNITGAEKVEMKQAAKLLE